MTDAELKQALIRWAKLVASDTGMPPASSLTELFKKNTSNLITDGTEARSVASNGHSVSFDIPCSRGQLVQVLGQAIDWVEAQPDPLDPVLPVIAGRMRMNFGLSTST